MPTSCGWRPSHPTFSRQLHSLARLGLSILISKWALRLGSRYLNNLQVLRVQPEPQLQLVTSRLLRYLPWHLFHGSQSLKCDIETDLKNFVWDLGREGFVFQLISLAGLHSGAVTTFELSKAFKEDGMLAYVNLIQKKEKAIGCDVLTHQKWYVIRLFVRTNHSIHSILPGVGPTTSIEFYKLSQLVHQALLPSEKIRQNTHSRVLV